MQESPDHTHSTIFLKLSIFREPNFPHQIRTLVLATCIVSLSFCNPPDGDKIAPAENPFLYDLESPDARYKLPGYLEEISGLSYYGKGKIACVQDEKANIYVLNLEQEKIVKKYDFGTDADLRILRWSAKQPIS